MFLQFTTVNNNISKKYQGKVASNSMFIPGFTKIRQSVSVIMNGYSRGSSCTFIWKWNLD
jgi:hypothetical protein